MTMTNPRAELMETYRDMSDEELLERWTDGHLTEVAMEVAQLEMSRRGIPVPEISPSEGDDGDVPEERVTFVTVARSLGASQLQTLRARLDAEGIPSFVADEGMNRMISLYSLALGGMRLMVPEKFADDARQLIALVKSGRLAYREGDDPG